MDERTAPLVSIITTTYNHEQFIDRCIQSVKDQIYSSWELIIVDDGSLDRTVEIVRDYMRSDDRIKLIANDHRGIFRLAESYNDALRYSSGSLIAILEGDDFWPVDKLAVQVPRHMDSHQGLSFGIFGTTDITGQIIQAQQPRHNDWKCIADYSSQAILLAYLEGSIGVLAVTVIVTKTELLRIGGFQQPSYLQEVAYPTWLQVGHRSGIAFINHVLGYWRQYSFQTTWNMSRELAEGIVRYSEEFAARYLFSDNEEVREFSRKMRRNRNQFIADSWYRTSLKNYGPGKRISSIKALSNVLYYPAYVRLFFQGLSVFLYREISGHNNERTKRQL